MTFIGATGTSNSCFGPGQRAHRGKGSSWEVDPLSSAPTVELIEQALSGDREAAKVLVKGMVPVIQVRVARVLAKHHVRSWGDARQDLLELTQDVLLKLFEDAGKDLRTWDPAVGPLASYVGAIAENHATGSRRRIREQLVRSSPEELPPRSTQDLSMIIEDREIHRAILAGLMAELTTPHQQDMLQMIVFDGLSVEEICGKTSMSHDAVYKVRERIRKLGEAIRDHVLSDSSLARATPPTTPSAGG